MNFAVKVTPEISEALQKIAFKNGYVWFAFKTQELKAFDYEYLYFVPHEMGIRANKGSFRPVGLSTGYSYELVSIEKAIELLSEEHIKIGPYTVVFKDKTVTVGCQTVSLETVEKIYKKLKSNV
jgi:hypothetical protein